MTRLPVGAGLACAALILATASPARGNPESEALRAKAASQIYSLDHDLAVATFRQAVAADPQDAGASRSVAAT